METWKHWKDAAGMPGGGKKMDMYQCGLHGYISYFLKGGGTPTQCFQSFHVSKCSKMAFLQPDSSRMILHRNIMPLFEGKIMKYGNISLNTSDKAIFFNGYVLL